jgi:hypothetical protein
MTHKVNYNVLLLVLLHIVTDVVVYILRQFGSHFTNIPLRVILITSRCQVICLR